MHATRTLAICAALAITPAAFAQDEVTSTKVSDNIYMLTGNGGNIGVLIGADGTIMIDDQYAPLTEQILAEVRAIGGDTPRFLLNTHFHGDHTGGNENLGKTGTVIVAHDNVRRRLTMTSVIEAFNMTMPPAPAVALPVITFPDEVSFHLNGETLRVLHAAAAHTDGDSMIHFQNANVVHTGDVLFNGFFPFIDVEHGGSVKGTIAACNTLLALVDERTRIIPGHGPLADKAQLSAYRDMLVVAQDRLSTLKAQGMSAEQAMAADPLADLQAKWGNAIFDSKRWVGIVWDGI